MPKFQYCIGSFMFDELLCEKKETRETFYCHCLLISQWHEMGPAALCSCQQWFKHAVTGVRVKVLQRRGHQKTLTVILTLFPVCLHAAGEPQTEVQCKEALHGRSGGQSSWCCPPWWFRLTGGIHTDSTNKEESYFLWATFQFTPWRF